MLDSETKKRIDDIRQILVGRLPSPEAQVKMITTGLIYKFMHDMDEQSVQMNGNRSFFAGKYKKYAWKNLFDPKLEGADRVNLYREAIENMYNNPGAPELFREIFKDADLPFRDAKTLSMFLKVVDEFEYSHSEKLGDAFEYLLSKMDSQGDAGQFRTPRHIIDFIVEIVNPQKSEKILDPACGTAGFLISSFKHIQKQNASKKSNGRLTAADRKRIGNNLVGYDINTDMTRLSLVNMYLHQFPTPQIHEYDTLSSEERWNEYYDVILANPPFFSPKGGSIQPHSRFGVKSIKAEVLFVDYIIEHLKPKGRAGIIVPEGIIFQAGNAYKTLRKKLVEDCLVGVISLPGGVFNPYSGVKTSILILDKEFCKNSDSIFFTKVESDGFSLGAQRTPVEGTELPSILEKVRSWIGGNCDALDNVLKFRILETTDYNLSFNKYLDKESIVSDFPVITVGDVCQIRTGRKDVNSGNPKGKYPFFTCARENTFSDEYSFDTEALLIAGNGEVGRVVYYNGKFEAYQRTYVLDQFDKILPRFLYFILQTRLPVELNQLKQGNTMPYIKVGMLKEFEIPLPPIEIQQEIVKELDGYQKIIDGCRQVVENYKPTINIDPSWEIVELGDLCDVKGGKRLPKGKKVQSEITKHPYIRVTDFKDFTVDKSNLKFITDDVHSKISRYIISSDDLYVSIAGTIGLVGNIPSDISGANLTENAAKLVIKSKNVLKEFIVYLSITEFVQSEIKARTHTVGVPKLALERIKTIKIPLPSLEKQKHIVEKIKADLLIIEGNKKLIENHTQKIQDRISKVWGE